jgi:hypothetical protein
LPIFISLIIDYISLFYHSVNLFLRSKRIEEKYQSVITNVFIQIMLLAEV